MPNQVDATNLLGTLPFGALIGGPLTAAIDAQAKAAMSSADFIEAIALTDDGKKVRTVTFRYRDSTGKDVELEVPILTIVPIPFIRIDDMTVEFKANISATNETAQSTTSSTAKSGSLKASARYLFVKAELSGSISSKKDSTATASSKYSVEYTIDVRVHAVQDDMPKGMATVLQILNESIQRTEALPAGGGKSGGGKSGGG